MIKVLFGDVNAKGALEKDLSIMEVILLGGKFKSKSARISS
jgi:hypothetical protein